LKKNNMKFKRNFSRSEIILIVMLVTAIVTFALNWEKIKNGVIRGWENYNIVNWFSKD